MISNLSNDRFGRTFNMCDNFWNENPFRPRKQSYDVVNNIKYRSVSADIAKPRSYIEMKRLASWHNVSCKNYISLMMSGRMRHNHYF